MSTAFKSLLSSSSSLKEWLSSPPVSYIIIPNERTHNHKPLLLIYIIIPKRIALMCQHLPPPSYPPGPPETPVILGYERGQELRKGKRQRLTCVSNGGNPLATLTWYKGAQKLSSETHHDAVTALAELDILLDESDNGAEYRCEATNEATSHPLVNSTVLSVMCE